MAPNRTLRPAKRLEDMRSFKLVALQNFDSWDCQTCGQDLWLVDHQVGDAWSLNFCSAECSQRVPLSAEISSAFADAIEAGVYHVDALDVADAMLDGVPKLNATELRSRQWRERRIAQLRSVAAQPRSASQVQAAGSILDVANSYSQGANHAKDQLAIARRRHIGGVLNQHSCADGRRAELRAEQDQRTGGSL